MAKRHTAGLATKLQAMAHFVIRWNDHWGLHLRPKPPPPPLLVRRPIRIPSHQTVDRLCPEPWIIDPAPTRHAELTRQLDISIQRIYYRLSQLERLLRSCLREETQELDRILALLMFNKCLRTALNPLNIGKRRVFESLKHRLHDGEIHFRIRARVVENLFEHAARKRRSFLELKVWV